MEGYLSYCLDSLIVTNHRDLLEVLIVNDGSKDRTIEIAYEYEDRYPDLFHVINKDNGNYGSCINAGLPQSSGKYIKVLDADDSFDTINFDLFISFLIHIDADLILSDIEVVDVNRVHLRTVSYNSIIKGTLPFIKICESNAFIEAIQMHAVTYKREMLVNMNYHQTEGISYTDQQWIFTPMIMVKNVAYFNKIVYRYLVGREGQTMDPNVKLRSMAHAIKNSFGLVSDYENHKKEIIGEGVRNYLYSRLSWYIKDIYVFYICHYNKDNALILREYDRELKVLSPEIYDMLSTKEISSFYGFAYLDYWRKHKIPIVLVRVVGRIYKALLDFKARKKVKTNNLSIGN